MIGQWDKLDREATELGGDLGYLAGDLLDRARINADDTYIDGVRVTGSKWDEMAIGSLETLLTMRDEDVECIYSKATAEQAREWFAARGIKG